MLHEHFFRLSEHQSRIGLFPSSGQLSPYFVSICLMIKVCMCPLLPRMCHRQMRLYALNDDQGHPGIKTGSDCVLFCQYIISTTKRVSQSAGEAPLPWPVPNIGLFDVPAYCADDVPNVVLTLYFLPSSVSA